GLTLELKLLRALKLSACLSLGSHLYLGSSLMHNSWHAACDERKAAELCCSTLRMPRPPILLERLANNHSESEKELHKNDSKQSRTALSKQRRAAECFWWGTTRKE
ncbi:unnamed protein product, partial [Meganyctiphanes norvegica]